ncbi:NUDIX hydrolase [Methylobacterium nodulans]|uniref:NUDIX hydrolase n=1 Tax=Methylobacterium nodulans (strain LMG 21967 / CNCM I-2342 / ORS 2060) TaxID=460265 RepID=B8IHT0_METNO|nr:NUDIX hydrolase [Methylobacterium nodulans]ACL55968.1 NUDIX hydrolase [Methylobacterium nodulans ORS 2060]
MRNGVSLTRAERVSAALRPYDWAWARENRARIAAHWAERLVAKPAMFNGRVMLASAVTIRDGTAEARLFESDFATLMAFRDFGFPDPSVANIFAAVAPRSRDGAYLLGRMNGHTANAGQVYFACGTPDPSDVRDHGIVDLEASALRELEEETGLVPPQGADEGWILVRDRGYLAFIRPMAMAEEAGPLIARAQAHLAGEAVPELSGIVAVHGPQDIDPAVMPVYAQVFLHDAFRQGAVAPG